MNLDEISNYVDSLISERRQYGVRETVAESVGYGLIWSNSAGRWYVGRERVKKGKVMHLDANEVFVPGVTYRDLKRVTDEESIMDLPLFGGSFERRVAGTPDYTGVELPPAIKLMRDADLPREGEVSRALERKGLES